MLRQGFLFLSYRKLHSYTIKMLRKDAHSREKEICRKRPRSARAFRERKALFYVNLNLRLCNDKIMKRYFVFLQIFLMRREGRERYAFFALSAEMPDLRETKRYS